MQPNKLRCYKLFRDDEKKIFGIRSTSRREDAAISSEAPYCGPVPANLNVKKRWGKIEATSSSEPYTKLLAQRLNLLGFRNETKKKRRPS